MAIHDEDQTRPEGGGLALASLLTGVISVFACGLGIIAGPVAVVLGIISGRRFGFGVKQIVGIVAGAFAFVFSAIVLVVVLLVVTGRDDADSFQPAPVPTNSFETVEPTDDAAGDTPTLTEAWISASAFDTAYEAYADTYDAASALDGLYWGRDIDTPCFTMDGEAWWITQGSPETCEPASELWWETYPDTADPEIKLFGSGGVGASISFEALTTEVLMNKFGTTDLATVSGYARDTLLPDSGATDIVETAIELGGLPAVQLDCSIGGLAAYRLDVVMLPEPRILENGTEIAGFIIHAHNEAEWVYRSEDVFTRLDNSLTWK